jgi:hypothetical protein
MNQNAIGAHSVEGGVGKVEVKHVSQLDFDGHAGVSCASAGLFDHGSTRIDADNAARGTYSLLRQQQVVADATADFEDMLARLKAAQRDCIALDPIDPEAVADGVQVADKRLGLPGVVD